ncbi:LysR family transcriptional regulator [Pigmentiphaga sp. NML080357]|uniref:LysR family transcriptional regulator n=1 Tax=Pigmentiphaga sp. NML080357 TaxID=2008675 RepID=UPI000B41C67F|nr:LysR family transcriptional regulator [Pigmentiphaga sp. NML080357]OVZ55090.1 LysR family transcriptional regulator [Pigmentiphaga sp. NML080357]
MDRFVAMSVFRKVVEHESFTLAARQLGMSVGTVSKYLSWLEVHLGTSLLARTTRRLNVTEAGRNYYVECVRLLDDLDEVERSAALLQTLPRGLLKVRAPVSLDYAGFGHMVGEFLRQFPAVKVEMTLNDRFADLDEEGFDVALALGSNQKYTHHPTHATRAIARMTRTLAASPAYLSEHREPSSPPELKQHDCLVYDRGPAPDEWHFSDAKTERMVHVGGSFRSNNSQVLKDALLEGCGVGMLPTFMIADELRRGRLVPVMPRWTPASRTLYAIYPRPRHSSPKVREFVEFVAARFDDDARWRLDR